LEVWTVIFFELQCACQLGVQVQAKNIQRQNSGEGNPSEIPHRGLHYKTIVHWLRLHLGGRRRVDLDMLKLHVQQLTERQWSSAVRPSYGAQKRTTRDSARGGEDVAAIPASQPDPAEALYLQELLSILEENLMSEEIPYFRAIVDRTSAKDLARELGAQPNTVSKKMKQVRLKTQSIIKALDGRVSS
jgi:hypothetical protein